MGVGGREQERLEMKVLINNVYEMVLRLPNKLSSLYRPLKSHTVLPYYIIQYNGHIWSYTGSYIPLFYFNCQSTRAVGS